MPSISQTTPEMPVNLHVDTNRVGHINRRGRSRKQSASLTSSVYPVVSHEAYTQLTRGSSVPEELSSLRLRRLAMGRQALGNCLTTLQNVQHDHREGQAGLSAAQMEEYTRVFQAARAAYKVVEEVYLRGYPLEVR